VRLEGQHQAPPRPALAHRLERRGDLGRVMAVVVDDLDAAARRLDLAEALQPPADALEAGERGLDVGIRDSSSVPTAIAASAFSTLCVPGRFRVTGSGGRPGAAREVRAPAVAPQLHGAQVVASPKP
jgi:hypothetical protein